MKNRVNLYLVVRKANFTPHKSIAFVPVVIAEIELEI